jgi:hypothetical protein
VPQRSGSASSEPASKAARSATRNALRVGMIEPPPGATTPTPVGASQVALNGSILRSSLD